jgi:hypothetical protein
MKSCVPLGALSVGRRGAAVGRPSSVQRYLRHFGEITAATRCGAFRDGSSARGLARRTSCRSGQRAGVPLETGGRLSIAGGSGGHRMELGQRCRRRRSACSAAGAAARLGFGPLGMPSGFLRNAILEAHGAEFIPNSNLPSSIMNTRWITPIPNQILRCTLQYALKVFAA